MTTRRATRRPTRQQQAVADLLSQTEDFAPAQEVHARLPDPGESVGLATVYRTLQALAEAGEVDVLRTDEGEAVYRACEPGHHHHLVCRRCGRAVEDEGPAVGAWAGRVASEPGYPDSPHTLEIFGTCSRCSAGQE